MGVHEVLTLIEEHGLSVVLLILAIFMIVSVVRWLGKKFDVMWKVFLDLKRQLPDEKKESVELIVNLNVQIKALLREAMAETQSGWCQLWQFHNGTRGLGRGKIPFMYISLTNEVCKPDVTEMRSQFKELPLSMFDSFAEQLISQDLVIHNPEHANPDGTRTGMGKLMQEFTAKCSAMRALRDSDGKIIGFMSFVFNESCEISPVQRQQIMTYSQRMTALLASLDEEE